MTILFNNTAMTRTLGDTAAQVDHRRSVAILAPSAMQRNLDQTTDGDTGESHRAKVPKPQSEPAMMRSRPTTLAQLHRRCAISLGCSTKFDV
jgi:hypothetical protein